MSFIKKNFARATLASNLLAGALTMTVSVGHNLPTTAGVFRILIWNATGFPDPFDDSNKEIVTASYSGTPNIYNLIRAQENTSDVLHAAGSRAGLHYTAGISDDDIYDSTDFDSDFAMKTLDDLAAGVTNVHLTTALKSNYDAAYSHSLITSGNPHQVTANDLGLGTDDSPTFAGLTLTGKTGILWANAGVVTGDATLDQIGNLAANKTFNNGAFSLSFNFTNPTNQPTYDGAFEIQASGAFTGDLFHVHQHTGNPGAGTHLVKLEAEDSDVHLLHMDHAAAASIAIHFLVSDAVKSVAYADGKLVIGHTALNSAVLRLNNATDACRLIFDVEGLAGVGRQSWGIQTDRAVNGDFAWLRGAVGSTPGTIVFYSDPTGNTGVGKYSPATKLDVDGTITCLDLNVTAGSLAYELFQKTHWIDVTASGVDNTGVTDAAADIQTLVDAADAGSVIYLPKGTYRLESTITLPAYIGLIGDGIASVTLSYVGAAIALVVNPLPAVIGAGMLIGGFSMQGPSTVGTSIAIQLIDGNRYQFRDILISRFLTGINLHAVTNYCEDNIFDNLHFTGSGLGNSLKHIFSITNEADGQDFDHNTWSNIWADLVNGSGAASTDFIYSGSSFTNSSENWTFQNIILFGGGDSNAKFYHSLNEVHTVTRARFDVHRVTTGYVTFIPFYLETSGDLISYSGYVDGGAANSIAGGATVSVFISYDDLSITGDLTPTADNSQDLGAVGGTDYRWRNLYLSGNLSDETNTLTIANAKAAYDHVSSSGDDHSYIDQDVTIAGTPQFARLGLGLAADADVQLVIKDSAAGNQTALIRWYNDGTAAGQLGVFGSGAGTYGEIFANTVFFDVYGTTDFLLLCEHASGMIRFATGAAGGVERGRFSSAGGFYLTELAADDADIAGKGQLWVRNDTPNNLCFTDDTGVIYELSHNLTTDIDHDSITNTHNLTTDIDHDALTNFVANEHINHTGVTLTAGAGLTGGGDISANRSFAVSLANGEDSLPDDFNITSDTTWQTIVKASTARVGVTLPAAGTYVVFFAVGGLMKFSAGADELIQMRLYNYSDSAEVSGSTARPVVQGAATNVQYEGHSSSYSVITVASSKEIVIQLYRTAATWTFSQCPQAAKILYFRIA